MATNSIARRPSKGPKALTLGWLRSKGILRETGNVFQPGKDVRERGNRFRMRPLIQEACVSFPYAIGFEQASFTQSAV